MAKDVTAARDNCWRDFNQVVSDTENCCGPGGVGGEKATARVRASRKISPRPEAAGDLQRLGVEQGHGRRARTDDYVHENPWQVIAIAAGVGVLVGSSLNSRR